jgi:ADP-ribose pyrophosphatase YjhB (NUDIX family)
VCETPSLKHTFLRAKPVFVVVFEALLSSAVMTSEGLPRLNIPDGDGDGAHIIDTPLFAPSHEMGDMVGFSPVPSSSGVSEMKNEQRVTIFSREHAGGMLAAKWLFQKKAIQDAVVESVLTILQSNNYEERVVKEKLALKLEEVGYVFEFDTAITKECLNWEGGVCILREVAQGREVLLCRKRFSPHFQNICILFSADHCVADRMLLLTLGYFVHHFKGDSLNPDGYEITKHEMSILENEDMFRELSQKICDVPEDRFDRERYCSVLHQEFTMNDHCRVLTIPKGKKEPFETLRQTCIKEAKQETEQNVEEIVEHQPFVEHLKPTPKGTRYHQKTLVLLATIEEVRRDWLMPQGNVEIESCHFLNLEEVNVILKGGARINKATHLTLKKLVSENFLRRNASNRSKKD